MKYLILLCLGLFIISCEKYDEDVLPVIGVYEANIVGEGGPFSISVSSDFGNNILIDAPWDGENWFVAEARVTNEFDFEKDLRVKNQEIENGVRLSGDGIFFDYSIQLDYTIRIDGVRHDFTLVGTKL